MLRSVDVAAALIPAVTAFANERGLQFGRGCQCIVGALGAQQRLYLRPLPHGHGSLRPIFRTSLTRGAGREALARDRRRGSKEREILLRPAIIICSTSSRLSGESGLGRFAGSGSCS